MSDESLSRLETHVSDYLTAQDGVAYNRYTDFGWADLPKSIEQSDLKEIHFSAIETAMLVEDHIPGYASEYIRLFQVESDQSDEDALMHRQMLHFVFRWIAEEDRHGHVLELYLRHSGRRDPAALTALMARESKKKYHAPHDNLTALAVYTCLQEKATQLFYNSLRRSVDEPILRSALGRLAQDEGRHCYFFSQLVMDALVQPSDRTISLVKEAMEHFEMPLAHMLDHYKRKAIQMAHAANGYNYMEAFDHFGRILSQVARSRTNSRSHPILGLILLAQELKPA